MGYWDRRTLRGAEYFRSLPGLFARHRACQMRRVYIDVHDVEPRQKPRQKRRMQREEELRFQEQVRRQMQRFDRAAFRGPIVLQLSLGTTAKNPPHAHSIAKNLLDLLSKPFPELGSRHSLLYLDDQQIHGLAVRCHHRQEKASIGITVAPLSCFLSDLDLAVKAERNDSPDRGRDPIDVDMSVESLRRLLKNEAVYRERQGDAWYEAMRDFSLFDVQHAVLTDSQVTLQDLAALYLRSDPQHPSLGHLWRDLHAQMREMFRKSYLRIHLDELPQQSGRSQDYLRHVDEQVERFRARLGWMLQPLRVPVALQVIVKPPPPERANGLYDLDNVARTYIIPRVVEVFAPPTDIAWTIDIERLRASNPDSAAHWESLQAQLPKTSRTGLTRFEVWRVPADEEPGFVSAALVADIEELPGPFMRIDSAIDALRQREDSRRDREW
ncbi:MAG TPA: hypothetical protein VK399_03365 [Longimicrobiaceae bacterium]|nr:hypothetical protein [Longimicrobiaceae bacterium]